MTTKKIHIIFENDIYDITDFISSHPGEGICNIYLRNYNGKDITEQLHYYHFSNEAYDILYKSKEFGSYKGVIYINKK